MASCQLKAGEPSPVAPGSLLVVVQDGDGDVFVRAHYSKGVTARGVAELLRDWTFAPGAASAFAAALVKRFPPEALRHSDRLDTYCTNPEAVLEVKLCSAEKRLLKLRQSVADYESTERFLQRHPAPKDSGAGQRSGAETEAASAHGEAAHGRADGAGQQSDSEAAQASGADGERQRSSGAEVAAEEAAQDA